MWRIWQIWLYEQGIQIHQSPSLFLFGVSEGGNTAYPLSSVSPLRICVSAYPCIHPSRVKLRGGRVFEVAGYSSIPEKLVKKIWTGQFINLASLLAENLKAQETEPQIYLVTSSKKWIQEIIDIVTWVEAFTVYSWILCSAHPSRWQDMTQYKLLILKTSRQFPGKAWLHYDIVFCKDAVASGLVD